MGAEPTTTRDDGSTPAVVSSRIWYRAVLTAEQVSAGLVMIVREQFAEALGNAEAPAGVCLFAVSPEPGKRRATAGRDEPPPALYFSPASVSVMPYLIAACGAEPSAPPDRAHATLLVGQPSDWSLLAAASH